jgi:hypothetical protein
LFSRRVVLIPYDIITHFAAWVIVHPCYVAADDRDPALWLSATPGTGCVLFSDHRF